MSEALSTYTPGCMKDSRIQRALPSTQLMHGTDTALVLASLLLVPLEHVHAQVTHLASRDQLRAY
jgi:hypothetical protein